MATSGQEQPFDIGGTWPLERLFHSNSGPSFLDKVGLVIGNVAVVRQAGHLDRHCASFPLFLRCSLRMIASSRTKA